MKEDLIHSLQKFVEVDEPEAEAVPLVPAQGQQQMTQVNQVDDSCCGIRPHVRRRPAAWPGRPGSAGADRRRLIIRHKRA